MLAASSMRKTHLPGVLASTWRLIFPASDRPANGMPVPPPRIQVWFTPVLPFPILSFHILLCARPCSSCQPRMCQVPIPGQPKGTSPDELKQGPTKRHGSFQGSSSIAIVAACLEGQSSQHRTVRSTQFLY